MWKLFYFLVVFGGWSLLLVRYFMVVWILYIKLFFIFLFYLCSIESECFLIKFCRYNLYVFVFFEGFGYFVE